MIPAGALRLKIEIPAKLQEDVPVLRDRLEDADHLEELRSPIGLINLILSKILSDLENPEDEVREENFVSIEFLNALNQKLKEDPIWKGWLTSFQGFSLAAFALIEDESYTVVNDESSQLPTNPYREVSFRIFFERD